MARILITGSRGLVGREIERYLTIQGHTVSGFDIAPRAEHADFGDILDLARLSAAAERVDGIVHLAAVARVKHAEADPEHCNLVNVVGTENVVAAARGSPSRPWLLFASSREVYGEPKRVPVREDNPIAPLNTYGRSKARGEKIVERARCDGLQTAIVRLANVYGSIYDHPDRVVSAFCRAAAQGTPMRIEGRGYVFDFTHVRDVARGVGLVIDQLVVGRGDLLPIHLASGRATSLEALAELANAAGGGRSTMNFYSNAPHNVSCFIGDPTRAFAELRWSSTIDVEEGVPQLVEELRLLACN